MYINYGQSRLHTVPDHCIEYWRIFIFFSQKTNARTPWANQ